ncbi:type II secretion system protein N [Rhodoferax aquaticus]|uniref:General secretion pathway protein C n=1 Tax=Rhodoferax aquaticus TaxID=2527691 RepID=A0A515ELF5_9BURK|nr:type II secretion system protein N [Rhodoferax aquaticus]QDL53487.1 general secretion pathway protein C [Rhodoferax aquaticus]
MLTTPQAPPIWTVRFFTLLLALAAGACAAYWWLKLPGADLQSAGAPATTPAVITDVAAVASALGYSAKAAPVPPEATPQATSSRFTLLGVVADTRNTGSALIAVDGQAAKAFAVGALVAPGWAVKSVQGRSATLADPDTPQSDGLVLQMAPLPTVTLP